MNHSPIFSPLLIFIAVTVVCIFDSGSLPRLDFHQEGDADLVIE
jgi:hypothetical protein